jgi:hypothetical protein
MAGNPVYVGPADNLIVADKLYHPGDAVPLDKDARANLELNGHRFSDSDAGDIAARIAAHPGAAPDTRPRGDRGEVLEMDDARKAPADPTIAPPPRAVKAEN